jgi:mono/diheme cytochrome c family protein
MRVLFTFLTIAGVASGSGIPGDAQKGAELIRSQGCVECHRIGGTGGNAGPDLGKPRGRNYTPSSMASQMWNHAPAMWSAMEKMGSQRPSVSEAQAGDMFAYFQSIRYFDQAGDAARGKRAFAASRCADCHGRSSALFGGAPPISAWKAVASPIMFAQQMWNHSPKMQDAMAKRKMKWTAITAQELTDIMVYVQSLPETRGAKWEFSLGSGEKGEALLAEKGCKACHQGGLDLSKRKTGGSLTDFAVAMWNHAPQMAAVAKKFEKPFPLLEPSEMASLMAYLWDRQIYGEQGNVAKGTKVFEKKSCGTCHGGSGGGPDLKAKLAGRTGPVQSFSMVAVLWQHGPQMLEGMRARKLAWPGFSDSEMLDLIAYLNSLQGSSKGD